MTHRERALAAYRFEKTDLPAFDLMEGTFWPELKDSFVKLYGKKDEEEILCALGCDFRWNVFRTDYPLPTDNVSERPKNSGFSDTIGGRRLRDVHNVNDLRRIYCPDSSKVVIPDFKRMREKYREYALVCCPTWMPCFSGACDDFGMERAMELMVEDEELIREYVRIKGEFALEVIKKCLSAGAGKYCDIFFLGDDFSGEKTMLLSPGMWRNFFKETLRRQVQEIRDAGLLVMFHSCGHAENVYEDFIEIGINAHVGVQTSCPGMSAEEIACKYGGRLVIHGGVDAQTTLVRMDEDGIIRQTERNIAAFEPCGGYIASNSHHGIAEITADKIVAMSKGAGRWRGF